MEALALAFSWLRRAPSAQAESTQASTQATGLKILLEIPGAAASARSDKQAEDFPALPSQLEVEAVIASSDAASSVPEYDAPPLEDLQEPAMSFVREVVTPIELEDYFGSSSVAPPSQLEAVITSSDPAPSGPEYDPPPLPVLEDDLQEVTRALRWFALRAHPNLLLQPEAVMVGTVDSVQYSSFGGKTTGLNDDDDENLSWEDIKSLFRTWSLDSLRSPLPSLELPSKADMHLEVEELKQLIETWTWKLPETLRSIKAEIWSRLLDAGLEEDEVTSQELLEELKNFLGWHRFPVITSRLPVITSRRMLLEAAPAPPISENGPVFHGVDRFIAPLRQKFAAVQEDGEEQGGISSPPAAVFWQSLRGDGTSTVRKPPDKNNEELVAEESSYTVLKSHHAAGFRKLRQADISSTPASVFWRSLQGDGTSTVRTLPYKNSAAAMAKESSYKVLKSHAAAGSSRKLLARREIDRSGDTKKASSSSNSGSASPSPPPSMWRWFPRSLDKDGGKAKRINTEKFQEVEETSTSTSQSLLYDAGMSSGSVNDFIELFEGEGISSSNAILSSLLEGEGRGNNADLQLASSNDLNLQATAVAATPLLLPILAGLLVALLFLFFLYLFSVIRRSWRRNRRLLPH
ncbi:hypothetical protein SELMODRAFT_406870 [Selaginella moellendorffii]|uniref:Uncharacterized protein n=1 Tax=Selaginella moellendorffii TaxID=88036 RepID=D8R374_SELML|nr:hypothetical protein SELMODRAFT_406870 [Selaginella moellendorffii]